MAGKRFAKNTESPLEFEGPTLKEPYFEAPAALFDLKKLRNQSVITISGFGSQVTRGEGFYGTPLAQSGDRSLLEHFENVAILLLLINFSQLGRGNS